MRPTLDDFDYPVFDFADDSVRVINPSTPITGKIAPKRLWLPDAEITIPIYVLQ